MASGEFRGDLDLEDILSDYEGFLFDKRPVNYVKDERRSDPFTEFERIPEQVYNRHRAHTVDQPFLIRQGPLAASTSRVAVSTRLLFSWDVNGWYRALGVPWPYVDVNRGSLGRYYQEALETSTDHPRLMYYLNRLFDKEIRAEYDASPLGKQFLADKYVQEALRRKAEAEASRRTAAMGEPVDYKEVMDDWGYKVVEDDPSDALDTVANGADDLPEPPDEWASNEWGFSYWLWRSSRTDTDQLAHWQSLIIAALSEAGATIELSLGYMGRQPHPHAVAETEYGWVLFLNQDAEPSEEAALSAASALLAIARPVTPVKSQ